MPRSLRTALLVLSSLCAACAGTTRGTQKADALVAASPVHSEEEYAAARADFDALGSEDAGRPALRRALLGYLIREINLGLEHGHADEAEGPFKQALSLYSAAELRSAGRPSAEDQGLTSVARKVELAFRKRGAHEQVLTALAAQIALAPKDDAPRRRMADVIAWLETSSGDEESPDGATRVQEDLEQITKVLPAPAIVDELARRYRAPRPTPAVRGDKPSLRAMRNLMGEEQRGSSAYELTRLFMRVSDPARAGIELAALRTSGKLRGDESDLATLVQKVASSGASATDWVALSMYVVRQSRERSVDDRDVALRICRDAEVRFPKALEPRLCSGQLALSMEQLVVAMRSFESVQKLDPARREAWEALARIYQARLFQVVTEENLDVSGLPKELARVEAFHAEATKRFPQQPLTPGIAGAVFEVGRGYYNAGRINDAEKYLTRSIELEPSVAALELAATVRQKRADPQRAAVLLERAINTGQGPKEEQLYRRAKLRRQLADVVDAAGDAQVANKTRRGGVEDWDVLLDLGLQKEFAAEALLERGKLLYQLGEREEGLTSLARAIDAMPDRGSTYADVIAFLIPRGELEDALDAYHRALGRNEVNDYLKTYCSMWIVDLARRAGQPEDPLALAYLRSADGGKWFHDLARWATGRENETDLVAHANTSARRAEAAFYRAMKALRDGKPDDAKSLWKEVIATDMMAFFEFDMAAMYLKDGAPSQPRLPIGKKPTRSASPRPSPNERPAGKGEPPPDGSI